MKKGQILDSGFEILDIKDLPVYKSKRIWVKHIKNR